MTDPSVYPSLVDRALRYLATRSVVSETELGAHLFGLPEALFAGPARARWSKILGECLGGDPRITSPAPGRWSLRDPGSAERTSALPLDQIDFVAIALVADGPKPWTHRVVGVSALQVTGRRERARAAISTTPGGSRVLGRWESVTRPDRPRRLPGYLGQLGLGSAALEDAPRFSEVADDLLAFLGELPLVGLDVGLTVAFLQFELRRLGRPGLTNPLVDLVALVDLPAVGLPGAREKKLDLDRLAALLGVPPVDRRSLASRARLTADIACRLFARASDSRIATFAELGDRLSGAPAPTAGSEAVRPRYLLDRASLETFPTEPGVYLLEGADGSAHYVGKAVCLRARLSAYLTADLGRSRRMAGVVEATAHVETQTTPTELEALVLEARLISRLRPRYNVQRRQQLELAYIRRNRPDEEPAAGRRRSRWAVVEREFTPACLGPISAAAARRLLAEARRRFRLGGKRGTARWSERADEAWFWLADEVAATPVVGARTVRDLSAFALVAAWPPPMDENTLELEEAEETAAIGRAGWLMSDAGGDLSADMVEDDRAAPSDSSVRASGMLPDPVEEPAPATVRLVVFGRGGWLGGLTVEKGTSVEGLPTLSALIAEQSRAPANPSAAAELTVALRHAGPSGEGLIVLRMPPAEPPVEPPDEPRPSAV